MAVPNELNYTKSRNYELWLGGSVFVFVNMLSCESVKLEISWKSAVNQLQISHT